MLVSANRRYPALCRTETLSWEQERITEESNSAKPMMHLNQRKQQQRQLYMPINGSDNAVTGSFAEKGKHSFWKACQAENGATVTTLASLAQPPNSVTARLHFALIEEFFCKVLNPHHKDQQAEMVRKKQAESEKLPPTPAALRQAIMCSLYRAIMWNSDMVACPEIPSPEDDGWKIDGAGWTAVMATELLAPQTVLHLVECG